MLYQDQISINMLRVCSLGHLVVMRKQHEGTVHIPMIDREIYNRIPAHYNDVLRQESKKLIKRRRKCVW